MLFFFVDAGQNINLTTRSAGERRESQTIHNKIALIAEVVAGLEIKKRGTFKDKRIWK